MTSDDDFQTATGAQLAARLYQAALLADGRPWLGEQLHRAIEAVEANYQWRRALARYASAVYPGDRPYEAGRKIASDLMRFETGYRRILAGAKRPNSLESLLLPLMSGPRSYRAVGDALKIRFQLSADNIDSNY